MIHEIKKVMNIIHSSPDFSKVEELMFGNAKFRWFLLAPILVALFVPIFSSYIFQFKNQLSHLF